MLPQVAEINRRVLSMLGDELLEKLDHALRRLTCQVTLVDRDLAHDVSADRRKCARARSWPDPEEG